MRFLADRGRTLVYFLLRRHGQLLTILIFLLPSPATSQITPPPPPSIPAHPYTYGYGPKVNPRVGLFVVIGIFSISIITFLCVFLRHCRTHFLIPTSPTRPSIVRRINRGLNPAFIESFPTFDYSAVKALRLGKEALECAICLSEFDDDETLRLIPKCDHVFHAECVDVWLESHPTCPVCRSHLAPSLDECMRALLLDRISGTGMEYQNDDVAIEVAPETARPSLTRSRSDGNTSGRRGWFVLFGRSRSTGHVSESCYLENMERFTLRLPEEVRSQIISGNRTGIGSSRLDRLPV